MVVVDVVVVVVVVAVGCQTEKNHDYIMKQETGEIKREKKTCMYRLLKDISCTYTNTYTHVLLSHHQLRKTYLHKSVSLSLSPESFTVYLIRLLR